MTNQLPYNIKFDFADEHVLVRVGLGEWQGDVLPIFFNDTTHGNSGHILFNARSCQMQVKTDHPYDGLLSDQQNQNKFVLAIMAPFIKNYIFGWSPDQSEVIKYDEAYHLKEGYVKDDEIEVQLKKVQSQIIKKIASPNKVLIAGCSNGELVRQCRLGQMDAYGFDLAGNLPDFALPEVLPYLKTGSLSAIPFGREDLFDTLVAIDVFEHIPERELNLVLNELKRLEFKDLVFLINLNEWEFDGHITLRSLDWWIQLFSKHYMHVDTYRSFSELPPVYGNDGKYNHQWLHLRIK